MTTGFPCEPSPTPIYGLGAYQYRISSMNQQSMANSSDLIPAIERVWQRVIQLELNFVSYNLGSKLGDKQKKKLASWFDETKSKLALMKSAIEAEADLDELLHDLALPPFPSYSPEATHLLIQMLDEKQAACRRSCQFLVDQLGNLRSVARNKLSLLGYWQRRRLAKQVRMIEQGQSELAQDQDAFEQNVRNALRFVQGGKVHRKEKKISTEEFLQSFHASVQALLNQFQSMQKRAYEEHRQVLYMKTWLQDARAALDRPKLAELPRLKDLSDLNQSWDLYGLSHYQDARKRLTIARDYVQLQLKQLQHIEVENPWQNTVPLDLKGNGANES